MVNKTMEKAIFGAGCFWGVEEAFRSVPGVLSTTVGYTGGHTENPTYEDVCGHKTGHAEVVEVEFDPSQVSYRTLVDLFWTIHDPTTLNRQGPDIGDQYRSAVFYLSPEQEQVARESMEAAQNGGNLKKPIVTEISPASKFYRAEDYHQQYLAKRGIKVCH